MAAQHAPDTQAETAAKAVRTNGLLRVIGAGRHVAAAALQPKHDLQGREDNAVAADEKDDDRLHEPFSMAKFLKKATLLRTASLSGGNGIIHSPRPSLRNV
jgi:hypothetical protein